MGGLRSGVVSPVRGPNAWYCGVPVVMPAPVTRPGVPLALRLPATCSLLEKSSKVGSGGAASWSVGMGGCGDPEGRRCGESECGDSLGSGPASSRLPPPMLPRRRRDVSDAMPRPPAPPPPLPALVNPALDPDRERRRGPTPAGTVGASPMPKPISATSLGKTNGLECRRPDVDVPAMGVRCAPRPPTPGPVALAGERSSSFTSGTASNPPNRAGGANGRRRAPAAPLPPCTPLTAPAAPPSPR